MASLTPQLFRVVSLCLLLLWAGTSAFAQGQEETEAPPPEHIAFVYWQQGYMYHLLGEYESAIERYSRAIENFPTPEAYTYRGWSMSKLGRLQEAIGECKEAIRLDPDYGNPFNDIGVYLIKLQRMEEAVPWLKKAMRAKRYCCYQFPHYNLGKILLAQGRVTEAKRSFEKALSYEPAYESALKALEFIRRLATEQT